MGKTEKKEERPRPFIPTPVQTSTPSSETICSRSSQKIPSARMSFSDILGNVKGSSETGYRLLDIEINWNIFQSLACPECMGTSLILKDDLTVKREFANHFLLS